MKLIFDYRVLTHTSYTGVENYAKNILDHIKNRCHINIAKPKSTNKYLSHLWTHFVLPFKEGNVLFCPANITPIFVPKSKRLVVTIHDVAFLTYPESFSKFFKIYYKLIMPFIIRRADHIITVSNYSKDTIIKFYPNSKEKITTIYLGSNKQFQQIATIEKKNQILYVGSMNERKNFTGVLQAFNLLNDNNYKLMMVGEFHTNFKIDTQSKALIEDAKENSNIVFRSGIEDKELIRIYNESKLFIFPSFYEGFGLPVLEAMSCGTPVVCSKGSSLPEVGGDTVLYCDPYDIEDIKNKIASVLYNEKLSKKMIEDALLRTKAFSWETSAKKHLKIFREDLK